MFFLDLQAHVLYGFGKQFDSHLNFKGVSNMSYNRERIFKKSDGRCFYCGCKLDFNNFHADHFISKLNHGHGNIDNLVPSCPECNLMKGSSSIEEFRRILEHLDERNITGRLFKKYYNVKHKKIKFWFERQ